MITGAWLSGVDFLPKILLLTISFSSDIDEEVHPATAPHSLRAASRQAHVYSRVTQKTYPFWPTLTKWPDITLECSPETRRAPVATSIVQLSKDAHFPHNTVLPVTAPTVFGRIDLWMPGLDLEDAEALIAGPIRRGEYDRESGGIALTIDDGDVERTIQFPPGSQPITLEDFPEAPDLVVGRAHRQTIFGPFPDPIPAIQIDKEGRRFYLAEPGLSVDPLRFQVGGVDVIGADRPRVAVGRLASDPTRTYTQLIFPQPVSQTGLLGYVSASGGVGYPTDSAALTLLEDIGGYKLTRRARLELQRIGRYFNFSVFLNNSTPVLDLVNDRILPQTDLMLTQHLNRVDCLQLLGETGRPHVGFGFGLWNRVQETRALTRTDDIWNAIEILYRRTILPMDLSTIARDAFIVDKDYGGPIGSMLIRSQKDFGRRFLSLEAADLVQSDQGLPQGVVKLGELSAELAANVHRRHTYDTSWNVGLRLPRYAGAYITDPVRGLDRTAVRVTRWSLRPCGPRIQFQTEDRA